MEIINQPFNDQLGNRLIQLINSEDYHTLNIVVAFAKNSGVLRIKEAIEKFRKHGGNVNVYVGVDMRVTSYEALTNLFAHSDSLTIIHSEKGQTFHSKIYQFLGEKKNVLIIGSNNLTGGGLWTNFESSVVMTTDNSTNGQETLLDCIKNYFNNLHSLDNLFMPIKSQADIELLLESGYISKEIEERVNQRLIDKESVQRNNLFGAGYKVSLPKLEQLKKTDILPSSDSAPTDEVPLVNSELISVNSNGKDKTIWFETRRMTGGSRNILDLSKTSLVEKGNYKNTSFYFGDDRLMRGAVEFFDMNPLDTFQQKDITINFEGIDYTGNTILYPTGDNANGTWRLQIKGKDISDRKITDAFRSRAKGEEYYLVDKIITFTKIQSDYYYISIFPCTDLEKFKESSQILARNGSVRTSKYMGII